MIRQHRLMAALVCFALAAIVLLIFLDVNGLAQEPPDAIWVTPKFWTESKNVRYYPDGHEEYVTKGHWFENTEHTFLGEPGSVDVTKDVYDMLLRPWVNGLVANLCRFGFVDGEPAASSYFCEQGHPVFLPFVE